MHPGLSAEDELCLLLARAELSPRVRARALDLLASPLRWEAFWRRAEEHQVLLLIYRSLRGLEFRGVPEDMHARFGDAFRRNAARNLLFVAELVRVLRLLGEAGVRVIPLKGVALSEALYGDPAFRFISDIDMQVPAADAVRARRLLCAQGYASPFAEDFFLRHQFRTSADCPLETERGGLKYFLELHWTLLPHSSKDAEAMRDLWSRAQPREFFGVQAYGLTPEWQAVYLASHAAYHRWQCLKWVVDLHDLAATAAINWQEVHSLAARFDLEFAVGSSLAVCAQLYGPPLPPGATAIPAGVKLFPHSLDPDAAWDAPWFQARLLKRPSEKLRWLAEMLFVARQADQMLFHLPPSLAFLYYLLRPLRLACKWTAQITVAGLARLRREFGLSTKVHSF